MNKYYSFIKYKFNIYYIKRFIKYRLNKFYIKPVTWDKTLINYSDWTNDVLPEEYRQTVIDISKRFNKFSEIKKKSKILDVGCGTNIISKMSYKDFFGWDDADNPNWTGLDPLPGRATWIGIVEDMFMFEDNIFDKIQISTSLDHFKDWRKGLKECVRVMKKTGDINIWFTDAEGKDNAHIERINIKKIRRFIISDLKMSYNAYIESWNNNKDNMTVFFKIKFNKN